MKEIAIEFYKDGMYTNEEFKVVVDAKWITIEEYEEITGVDYETGEPLQR